MKLHSTLSLRQKPSCRHRICQLRVWVGEDRGVGVSNLTEPYYINRWYGATRIP